MTKTLIQYTSPVNANGERVRFNFTQATEKVALIKINAAGSISARYDHDLGNAFFNAIAEADKLVSQGWDKIEVAL